ncbi:MAG: hypothetical protein LQ348_003576 [Seirophora lacunosa]|nr:MAG: hypothetical protein LQ348_003576 [Seirophora lacunosa]
MSSPKGFFRLPSEVRNQIYRLIVSPDVPDSFRSDVSAATSSIRPLIASSCFKTALIYANRQFSEEVTRIFYRDHLFVRIRFSLSSALESITNMGLQKTIRKNAESCPWITMAISVDAGDSNESEGPPTDIVVAHHDLPLLTNLLLYMHQRVPEYLRDVPTLGFNVQVINKARVSATIINDKLLLPLTNLRCYEKANVELPDPDIAKDFEQHPPPCRSSGGVQAVVAQLWLAKVLEPNHGVELTHAATFIALSFSDKLIEILRSHNNPDSTKLVTLLKLRIEASIYEVSLTIRTFRSKNSLDLFLGYCQALDAAHPGTRLLPLYQAVELYLRFARATLNPGIYPVSLSMLKNVANHDPQNELKLPTDALLETLRDRTKVKEFRGLLFQSLGFSELEATISRLYVAAGIP